MNCDQKRNADSSNYVFIFVQ